MSADRLREMLAASTPGPWVVGWTPNYLSSLQEQHVTSGHAASLPLTLRSPAHTEEIATVWNYLLPTAANARLIALAPDAIALLADLADEARKIYDGWLTGDFDWDELLPVLARVDALCGDGR